MIGTGWGVLSARAQHQLIHALMESNISLHCTARCCACLFQEQVIKGFGVRVIGAIERGQIAPGGGQ
jgi:hypothetical protein